MNFSRKVFKQSDAEKMLSIADKMKIPASFSYNGKKYYTVLFTVPDKDYLGMLKHALRFHFKP